MTQKGTDIIYISTQDPKYIKVEFHSVSFKEGHEKYWNKIS